MRQYLFKRFFRLLCTRTVSVSGRVSLHGFLAARRRRRRRIALRLYQFQRQIRLPCASGAKWTQTTFQCVRRLGTSLICNCTVVCTLVVYVVRHSVDTCHGIINCPSGAVPSGALCAPFWSGVEEANISRYATERSMRMSRKRRSQGGGGGGGGCLY